MGEKVQNLKLSENPNFNSPLVQQISNQIKMDFANNPGDALPSIRKLRDYYKVSISTVSKALSFLKDSGYLEGGDGRRFSVPGSHQDQIEKLPQKDEADAFYSQIKESILNGIYPLGEPLPKIQNFSIEFNLSFYLIRKTFERLLQEKLIHKSKNRYLAGPKGPGKVDLYFLKQPAILVICYHKRSWNWYWRDNRVWRFFDSFLTEATKSQYRIELLTFSAMDKLNWDQKTEYLKKQLKSLNGKFAGCLVAGKDKEPFRVASIVKEVINITNLPTIWFDSADTNLPGNFEHNKFARFHFSDKAMVKAGAEFLTKNNHSNILFLSQLCDTEPPEWEKNRAKLFENELRQLNPNISFTYIYNCPELWQQSDMSSFTEALRILKITPGNPTGKHYKNIEKHYRAAGQLPEKDPNEAFLLNLIYKNISLIKNQHELIPKEIFEDLSYLYSILLFKDFVLQPQISVIVSPSDFIAKLYHIPTLKRLQFKIPHEISHFTFDTYERGYSEPLSQVSTGFDRLGFKAFHSLAKTFGEKWKSGSVPISPFIMEQGTVARIKATENLLSQKI